MVKFLSVVIVILLLVLAGLGGGVWYQWYLDNNIFVEEAVYPVDSTYLDLRGQNISFDHYEQVHRQLPYCEIDWMVPFQGGRYDCDSESLKVSSLNREEIQTLMDYFPNLTTVDATGYTDYAILEEAQTLLPNCDIVYTVDIGGTTWAPDTQELNLNNGDFQLDMMIENLIHLPMVTNVNLSMPEEPQQTMNALTEAYPDITFHCTLDILGVEYDLETESLDLSKLPAEQVMDVAGKMTLLTNLKTVELTDSDGNSQLTMAEVKPLIAAAPQAKFHYTFELFGRQISTEDTEVYFKNEDIGDAGEAQIRQALDLLNNCKRFVLEDCGLSYEVLAKIRDDYRDQTKVVWRVYFGSKGGTCLTDVEILKDVWGLYDDNCHDLVYCEDVIFLDIGHNEYLDAVDFIAGMPNLEYVIVSGSPIKDLTPFENCRKLKFLELTFCEYVTDISPLAGCVSLEMLNIGNTHVRDLSPLDNMNMTHLMARLNPGGGTRVPAKEQKRFKEQHPDCWCSFTGSQPYGDGWRYEKDKLTYTEAYALIREIFQYELAPNEPNHGGWYLPDWYLEQIGRTE